jgi:peptidylprolyl isomerase
MRTRYLISSGLAALALTAAGCGGDDIETATFSVDAPPAAETGADSGAADPAEAATDAAKPKVEVPPGPAPTELVTKDLKVGKGPAAKNGDSVTVNYVGVLHKNGKEFDTSYGRAPFPVTLGQGGVIEGWDKGLVGIKAGGRRMLVIPPDMAYGAQGSPPTIGPNEALVFVVDAVSID